MKSVEKILVIRHGALGDFCMATGLMRAVRERHPGAQITLLTQAFLADLGHRLGFFDEIVVDNRSRNPLEIVRVCKQFIADRGYDIIYDFQSNHRTVRLYRNLASLFALRRLNWLTLGEAKDNCWNLLPNGVLENITPDLSNLHGENLHFDLLPERFALLIPGCGPKNPEKRWPAENYREVTRRLGERGIKSVVLGTKAEAKEIDIICRDNPNAVSFMDLATLSDIPDLARRSVVAVGNDTGPTHMARLAGQKTVMLLPPYSAHLSVSTRRQKSVFPVGGGSVLEIKTDSVWFEVDKML